MAPHRRRFVEHTTDLFEAGKRKRKDTKSKSQEANSDLIKQQQAQSLSNLLGFHSNSSSDTHNKIPPLENEEDHWFDDPNIDQFIPAEPQHEDNTTTTHTAGQNFADEARRIRNQQSRHQLQSQWAAIIPQLTATYLELQHKTENWTTQSSYLSNEPRCSCQDHQSHQLDLIDLLGQHTKHIIAFCKCTPQPVQLLQYGYLACTPQMPRTALSIRLIQFHHELWKSSVISTTGFVNGLLAFINTRTKSSVASRTSPSIDSNLERDLRRPFSHAIDVYRQILRHEKLLYEEGLDLSRAELRADQCSRCFGPSVGEVKVSDKEPHIIIALDGNFQHRHNIQSSHDTPQESDYPTLFLKPSQLKTHEVTQRLTDAQVKGMATSCSDSHTAANDVRNSSSWDRCDDTGLFGCTCRHDVPLKFANIYKTGEKLYYPVGILEDILTDLKDVQVGVLYDIGCHLEAHLNKRGYLPEHISRMSFGTSVFHAFVHKWECQIKYNPRFNLHWGWSDGEGLERLWSYLSALVSINRVSTRLHRLLNISLRATYFGESLTKAGAEWLFRKLANAFDIIQKTKAALTKLANQRSPIFPEIRYTSDFLRQQTALEQNSQTTRGAFDDAHRIELGRLLCLEEEADRFWETPADSMDEASKRLKERHILDKKIALQRSKIGGEAVVDHLNLAQQDMLLKVWYCKNEVRSQYLAVCEEKRPLEWSRRDGKQSSLGYNEKMKLISTIRVHVLKLKRTLDTYHKHLTAYRVAHPDRAAPAAIDYAELLTIDFDHPFWNDGLFTNGREPWAIDSNTHHGMRQLAYLDRAREEVRRLGWEVRRSMCWAVESHTRLWTHFKALHLSSLNLSIPQHLIDHPSLLSLTTEGKYVAARVVILKYLLNMFKLQEKWHEKMVYVFKKTQRQDGDIDLLNKWNEQVQKIKLMLSKGWIPSIPGCFLPDEALSGDITNEEVGELHQNDQIATHQPVDVGEGVDESLDNFFDEGDGYLDAEDLMDALTNVPDFSNI